MATIRLHGTTTATPEQFLAALTAFGSIDSNLWGGASGHVYTNLLPHNDRSHAGEWNA
jgi:hypothetical protein